MDFTKPEGLSALAVATAIGFGLIVLAFNLGRLDMASKVRQCAPTAQSFPIAFKGTLP